MLAGEKLQADIAAMLIESVDTVHLLNHVEDVDFYQLFTVHGQLVVRADQR